MSARRPESQSVQQLANRKGVEIEDALITLWEAGFDYVVSPVDNINWRDLKKAEEALGLATREDIRSLQYWKEIFGIPSNDLAILLHDFGISVSKDTKKVPKGGVSKLKAEARKMGIDPSTGVIVPRPFARKEDSITSQEHQLSFVQETEYEPIAWKIMGHERPLEWLSEDNVKKIYYELVKDFASSDEPILPAGIRNETLLASAVFRPHTSLGNSLKYPTVEMSAAALLHSIIQDHPFHNGNKRTALVSMLVFMDRNGMLLTCSENDLFKLVILVAQHKLTESRTQDMADREVLKITDWLCRCSRNVEKGERSIPGRRLKRILTAFKCHFEYAKTAGSKMNISRQITKKEIFGRKNITLNTQIFYGDDGRDVDIDTIRKIRADLYLDDTHGIDSRTFYEEEPEPTDFIAKYRKILDWLAKL
ncbi:MAG: type II toxin-antitoxin system death-on-curing family toxin [Syntrophorhabdaceae bacterium]|nr:type II toxin-antitoxin system death-on-curing family toxin [Syntrophorhabdaceae bacterium]